MNIPEAAVEENRRMTITEFLEARISEDEEVARAASHQKVAGPFHGNWHHDSLHLSSMERVDAIHVARHDPARVLAECAAKRAIIALHDYEWMGPDDAAGKGCEHDYEDWPCPTIRAIAAVYAHHPDYKQEWAL